MQSRIPEGSTPAAPPSAASTPDALDDSPGSPRWIRTAAALRDAADETGYDFDAYGDEPEDGYSGRGMCGSEVPALVLADRDEAAVVAHAFHKATGRRLSIDNLGRRFVAYPSRLLD